MRRWQSCPPSSFTEYSATRSLNWKFGLAYAYAPWWSSGFSVARATPSLTSKNPFPTFHFGAISDRAKSSSKRSLPAVAGPDCGEAAMTPQTTARSVEVRITGTPSFLDDLFDHPALEQGQAFVATQVQVGQSLLVEADLVQDRRVDV